MTLAASFWPRRFSLLPPGADLLIECEPGTRILTRCNWQREPRKHPALVLVHGLEGSSESGYMLGTAELAWQAGFNVIRMNQRNCGGTEHLTPSLYNSGLSCDVRAILEHLIAMGLEEIYAAGFSLGGNLVMKMAGEFGESTPRELAALAIVSPSLDLAACVAAIGKPRNRMYERYFLRRLKKRMRRKADLFPDRYRLNGLESIRTIRQFDDRITAPHGGFRDADDYYFRASALRVIERVKRPTLILTAQDDPLIPVATLDRPEIRENRYLRLVAPKRGGHCGFISGEKGQRRFWAERMILEFFGRQSRMGSLGSANP
jgi:predicted alpha/beta-fold hydrolase